MKAFVVLGTVGVLAALWWASTGPEVVQKTLRQQAAVEEARRRIEETRREEERKKAEAARRRPSVAMVSALNWPKEAPKDKVQAPPPPKRGGAPLKAAVRPRKAAAPPVQPAVAAPAGGGAAGQSKGTYGMVAEFGCDVDFYLRAMRQRGARVVIYENTRRKFYAVDDLAEESADGFSATSRRLTQDYPAAGEVLARARARLGEGGYEIILLLPGWLEERFQQGLRAIAERRVGTGALPRITNFHLVYEQSGGDLAIAVDRISVDGNTVSVGESFTL